jgi:hypothetical protein
VLTGAVVLGRVQWLIELPPGLLPLYSGAGFTIEQRWGWAGWLPAPRAAVSGSDLEQWMTGNQNSVTPPVATTQEVEPSLVCWQTDQAPLVLVYVPQRLWLLVCSLVFLIVGLGLFYPRFPRGVFWPCLVCCAAVAGAVGIWWPAALPAVAYGCEPGAVVLLAAMGIHGLLHARYRRRVVFMPGFKRAKTGSSLIQGGNHRGRELSTIEQATKQERAAASGLNP